VYNLTNARYQEVGGMFVDYPAYNMVFGDNNGEAYYPMPSRSFIIGAEYTF